MYSVSTRKNKAIVLYTNSVIVDTSIEGEIQEYVFTDIDDFLSMEQHQDRVLNDLSLQEIKDLHRNIAIIRTMHKI